MLDLIIKNAATIVVGLSVLGAVILAVRSIYKRKSKVEDVWAVGVVARKIKQTATISCYYN